ncbi:MAG: cobalt transporter CbiM [Desulfobacteraceae bacterium]|nr:cobalt transporter CbiM [Desulfobacteraceae bacterium]
MHISEGVLSGQVMTAGGVLAIAGTAVGLKNIDYDKIVNVAILASAFFVASLIHVNVGPSSVHLILNGIVGLLLGWAAFPAILVALLLQAVFFQFGGLTPLGVNTVIMAMPAIFVYYLFSPFIWKSDKITFLASFFAGAFAILFSSLLLGSALYFTEKNFLEVTLLIISANLPIIIIEGIVTGFCVSFFKKVYPEILPKPKSWKTKT